MPSVDLKSTMFCWCDLMTPDVESAKKFYGSLFGWSHEDMPGGEYGFHTMFSKGDVHVAGMGGLNLPIAPACLRCGTPTSSSTTRTP